LEIPVVFRITIPMVAVVEEVLAHQVELAPLTLQELVEVGTLLQLQDLQSSTLAVAVAAPEVVLAYPLVVWGQPVVEMVEEQKMVAMRPPIVVLVAVLAATTAVIMLVETVVAAL
jgi:hypothetical protein